MNLADVFISVRTYLFNKITVITVAHEVDNPMKSIFKKSKGLKIILDTPLVSTVIVPEA